MRLRPTRYCASTACRIRAAQRVGQAAALGEKYATTGSHVLSHLDDFLKSPFATVFFADPAALTASPTSPPGELAKKLYTELERHHHVPGTSGGMSKTITALLKSGQTAEESKKTAECGQFGTRPSDLFLKIYYEVLSTLDDDPWAGVVSPPLIDSRGAVPLSIISIIPDIIQHHCDCIVEADCEVFLATNFWQTSKSATKICDAFIELSRRAEQRGKKVAVKMMYDRANLKILAETHVRMFEDEWTGNEVKLPKESDMPGLDFELANYHQCVVLVPRGGLR
ncbi:hypothetical protein B0H21DRAFT_825714 [Amylocystis lapponica]|nr:hypothetical protein B0H21DRAFT_825714 [Amylocystis lapponica]